MNLKLMPADLIGVDDVAQLLLGPEQAYNKDSQVDPG